MYIDHYICRTEGSVVVVLPSGLYHKETETEQVWSEEILEMPNEDSIRVA